MTQAQVEGIKAKLAAFAAAASPLVYVAYGLATSFHETAQRMQPIPEIGRGRNYPYGKPISTTAKSLTAAAMSS